MNSILGKNTSYDIEKVKLLNALERNRVKYIHGTIAILMNKKQCLRDNPYARLNSQNSFHLFVHHIAYGDGRQDLEEVWDDSPVEASRTMFLHDGLDHSLHGSTRFWTWDKKAWEQFCKFYGAMHYSYHINWLTNTIVDLI